MLYRTCAIERRTFSPFCVVGFWIREIQNSSVWRQQLSFSPVKHQGAGVLSAIAWPQSASGLPVPLFYRESENRLHISRYTFLSAVYSALPGTHGFVSDSLPHFLCKRSFPLPGCTAIGFLSNGQVHSAPHLPIVGKWFRLAAFPLLGVLCGRPAWGLELWESYGLHRAVLYPGYSVTITVLSVLNGLHCQRNLLCQTLLHSEVLTFA